MTSGAAASERGATPRRVAADARPPTLACRVERDDDGAHYTVFPEGASDDELVTTWLTADEDALVDLDDVR